MKKNKVYIVATELDADDIASTIQKIKDRMMGYAYDRFNDGVALFAHKLSAEAYASGLGKGWLVFTISMELEK